MPPSTEDRFVGCLLGLAVGDALGAHFEGLSPARMAERYPTARALLTNPPRAPWVYTDDTQMTIGVAETLVAVGRIEVDVLARTFAKNYEAHRGYGPGAMAILQAILAGDDYRLLARELFPGGSFGNGAAMRVAPVGLAFRGDVQQAVEQATLSALPTHTHPLGIEGAQLAAAAVALACSEDVFDRSEFISSLAAVAQHVEYSGPLRRAASITDPRDLASFGNGIAAPDSVVTAIASFALTPEDYGATIANVMLLGGDTDTMAAIAGAISGAHLGASAIPRRLVDALEESDKGAAYVVELAKSLHRAFA